MTQDTSDKTPDQLLKELNQIDGNPPKETAKIQKNMTHHSKAWNVVSHIFSGILVGGVIGYGIDYWVGTTPWGVVIFFPIGFIAGMMNVIRMTREE